MSNTETTKSGPVITIADPAEETQVVEKKPNLFQRGVNTVRTHPKTTALVVLGAAAIGKAYSLGKKQGHLDEPETLELENVRVYDDGSILGEIVEDSTVA